MIGERIRELRLKAGYSQEGFAAEAGLDRAYYGGVERGERNIAALNLVMIAAVLAGLYKRGILDVRARSSG
ncbi:MAG: helix-turn-helix transcriptional regulator [Gammaproteobacteria bacterium]|nr:helix-turn-helix transcriptional regulator [Gammaproteobacteria bacterium]